MKNLNFKVYVPFQKTDSEEKIVEGYASSESLDSQGDIVKSAAIEKALPDYMKFANVREMHQHSAVGKAISAQIDKTKKALYLVAKVVDPIAWEKVKEGVYNGFSIGGRILKRVGNAIEELSLHEISLVDRPANPDAVFTVYKSADMPEEDQEFELEDKVMLAGEVMRIAEQLVFLYSAYESKGKDTSDLENAIELLSLVAQQTLAEPVTSEGEKAIAFLDVAKAKLPFRNRKDMPKSAFAYVDKDGEKHLPIHDKAHVRNALARFNQTQFESTEKKKTAARKILAAARRMGVDIDPSSAVARATKLYDTNQREALAGYFEDLREILR